MRYCSARRYKSSKVPFFLDALVNFWAIRGVLSGDDGSAVIVWILSFPFACRLAYASKLGEKLAAMWPISQIHLSWVEIRLSIVSGLGKEKPASKGVRMFLVLSTGSSALSIDTRLRTSTVPSIYPSVIQLAYIRISADTTIRGNSHLCFNEIEYYRQ